MPRRRIPWAQGSFDRNRLKIQKKNSAVGVIRLAARSLRPVNRINPVQILFSAHRRDLGEIRADEIAFGIDFRINPVVDDMTTLGDLNGHIVGGRAGPDRQSTHRVIGFPYAKVMTPGDDRVRIRQGIRIVLLSSEQIKPRHWNPGVVDSVAQQMPDEG